MHYVHQTRTIKLLKLTSAAAKELQGVHKSRSLP